MKFSEEMPAGAQALLELLVEASATLLGTLNPDAILGSVLELACKLNGAAACALWRRDESGAWRLQSSIGLSAEYGDTVMETAKSIRLADGPFSFEDAETAPVALDRIQQYRREGIRSLIALPMKFGNVASGALTLYYREPHHFPQSEIRAAAALANLAESAMQTAALYAEQERSRAMAEQSRLRSVFLAEASAVLASSLEYETTLSAVAKLAVPQVADWCSVDVVQPDGGLRRLALAHVDPKKVSWAEEMSRRYPPNPENPAGIFQVARTGRAEIVYEITEPVLAQFAKDPAHLEMLRAVGFTSYMCVPMIARGRVLGTISFILAESGRRYDEQDLALAEDLGRRAGIAVDNAALHSNLKRDRAALEHALESLRENEQRLRMALDAGRMGIWHWDLETGALHWSENLVAMHGFAPGGFDGTFETYLSRVHPEDRGGLQLAIERSIKEKSYFEYEFRVALPNGGVNWIAGKGQVISGPAGEPIRMIGVGMDVTERRRLEESVRNAQKLESIGVLAGGIAHDFNNLLTGILGNASLAIDLLDSGHAAQPLIESVIWASERAASLTQQLLAYSGKGLFLLRPVDVSELVGSMSELMPAMLPKWARLRFEMASGLPLIEADPDQIRQAIMSLVINAGEAIGDSPGSVVVKSGIHFVEQSASTGTGELPPGRYVSIEVHDTGCGMDRETQERIFDPFFTTKFTGRGLGLAAVSGIVRAHRGAIFVYSAPAHGSTFRLLFPVMGAGQIKERPQAAGSKSEDLNGSGIVLVVDDEEAVRQTAATALARYGYTVELASDGAEGVALFSQDPARYSAILLDVTMPVLSGEHALQLIKKLRPDVPVIASSGYSEMEVERRFPSAAVAAFLQKPYTGADLARVMKRVLRRTMARTQTNN